jgi:farnesyl-diphosphate farnesyltransferase
MLKATSRTFYIPISRLPSGGLQEAVASAYLCLRAIDEVEDHASLPNQDKAQLLRSISCILQTHFSPEDFASAMHLHREVLPEVTLRIADWALLAPAPIAPRVWEATATMADRMAHWADTSWRIGPEADLDRYTFGVAGSVGLLLSDLWAWYDGTSTNRIESVGFGRGLQAVNIVRNHTDDLARGVEFYPQGWGDEDMHLYARRNLALADAYTAALPAGPVREFCAIPLALAHATLAAMANGHAKLSRGAVLQIVEQATQK